MMSIEESVRSLRVTAVADEPPVRDASLQRVLRHGARRRSWRRRRPALAGGLAALLVVALAAGLLPRGAGGPAPAAAAVLDAAARTAATRTPPPLKPGQFWYTKAQGKSVVLAPEVGPHGAAPVRQFLTAQPTIDEEWWAADGVWRSRGRYGTPVVLDQDRAAWIAASRPPLRTNYHNWELRGQQARRFISWPGVLFPRVDWNRHAWNHAAQQLQQLPTDPTALERRLRDGALRDGLRLPEPGGMNRCRRPTPTQRCRGLIEADANVDIFQAATWLLARPITPPALRAALFRVLARLEGIRVLGPMTDEQGRSGTAVAITFDGLRHELIFDPRSSLLLAERDIVAAPIPEAPRFPVGITLQSELYLTRVVDSITATN
jgi:hypothetical protein